MSEDDDVWIDDAFYGAAPVTLNAGELWLMSSGASGRRSITFLRSQDDQGSGRSSLVGGSAQTGITYSFDDSHQSPPTVTFSRGGRYVTSAKHAGTAIEDFPIQAPFLRSSQSTLRLAQYICGFFGLLLVNIVMLTGKTSSQRWADAKDFIINFASDILAVGMVLLVADVVDRVTPAAGTAPKRRISRTPAVVATAMNAVARKWKEVDRKRFSSRRKCVRIATDASDDGLDSDDWHHRPVAAAGGLL